MTKQILNAYLLVLMLLTIFSEDVVAEQAKKESDSASPSYSIIHFGKGLSYHKEMFILPVSWANEYNGEEIELIFQMSAKQQIFDSHFYFAYTQKSFWQPYNLEDSSPFRETNYNPELFYRFMPGRFPVDNLGADMGYEHESNGQSDPDSRGWDRLYIAPFFPYGNTLFYLKLWYRTQAGGDNNSDITDFLGFGELHYFHQIFNAHLFHLTLKGNMVENKGAFNIHYSFPSPSGNMFFVIKLRHGYGESLIDYNRLITRVGIGIMFTR